jgi:hypothetical protein
MHSKCKLIADAENVFDQVSEKKTELWNAIISAYVVNGCASKCFENLQTDEVA